MTELGVKVKDLITGFEGRVTARCCYITGCNQLLVTAEAKEGKPGETVWFDEERCQITESKPIKLNMKDPGFGPVAPIR